VTSPFARRLTRVRWNWMGWVLATAFVVDSRYDLQLTAVLLTSVALYAVAACALLATTTGLMGAILPTSCQRAAESRHRGRNGGTTR